MDNPNQYTVKQRFYFGSDPGRRTYNEGETVNDFTEDQVKLALSKDLIEEAAEKAPLTLDGMTKAQLIEHAETNGIEIDAKANKADLLDAIRSAARQKPE